MKAKGVFEFEFDDEDWLKCGKKCPLNDSGLYCQEFGVALIDRNRCQDCRQAEENYLGASRSKSC